MQLIGNEGRIGYRYDYKIGITHNLRTLGMIFSPTPIEIGPSTNLPSHIHYNISFRQYKEVKMRPKITSDPRNIEKSAKKRAIFVSFLGVIGCFSMKMCSLFRKNVKTSRKKLRILGVWLGFEHGSSKVGKTWSHANSL